MRGKRYCELPGRQPGLLREKRLTENYSTHRNGNPGKVSPGCCIFAAGYRWSLRGQQLPRTRGLPFAAVHRPPEEKRVWILAESPLFFPAPMCFIDSPAGWRLTRFAPMPPFIQENRCVPQAFSPRHRRPRGRPRIPSNKGDPMVNVHKVL